MKLEHAAMYVHDLEATREFFIKYFEAKSNNIYHNPTRGFSSYFLSFDSGARLEIMNLPNLTPANNLSTRIGFVHLAFSVGSKEKVDALTKRLQDDGYKVLSGPRTTGDGYYESLIEGIEGNPIEIVE
ncbi:MAG: VOC family protein [Brevinema sp.]